MGVPVKITHRPLLSSRQAEFALRRSRRITLKAERELLKVVARQMPRLCSGTGKLIASCACHPSRVHRQFCPSFKQEAGHLR